MLDESALSRHVLRSLTDGIVVLGLDGTIRYANHSAEELLAGGALVGRSVDEFLDEAGRGHSAGFLAEAAHGRFLPDEVDTMLVRGDGRALWVRLRQTPYVEDDRVAGVVLRLTDNDETKELLEAVHASHRALVRAERIGRSGSWTWDLVSGEIAFSEGLEELYGERTADLLSRDRQRLVDMTHVDDQRRLSSALDSLLDGTHPRVDVEVRHLGRHGWMWVRLRAVGVYDADGGLKEASGTYQDITRARATEDRLQDLVTQTSLMQAVATAANTAATLDEILLQARDLVVLHDDWDRGRAFVPAPDGSGLVPHDLEGDVVEEPDTAIEALEAAVAAESYRTGTSVWDTERRLTLACPVRLGSEIVAIIVITSLPPLYRHDMIQRMVEDAALILARVAERERTERALSEARDRALDASRHKSEFLATMSHEIRTPLNGIIGLHELLDGTGLSDRQQQYVTGIGVSSRTLLELINDVLDFSKIEAGRLEVEVVDLKVREVLDEVTELLAESARLRRVGLVVSCADEVPEVVVGDPVRLRQVLLNLGSNAIKFTAAGSVDVRVGLDPADPAVLRFEVHDTGIGISAEQQEWIFAPFSQADSSTTRHYGGSGLGLAICAEIVAALGGEIGVRSAPGSGSTFWFTTPVGAAGRRRTSRPVEPSAVPVDRSDAAAVSGSDRRGRVLVVEDNPINQVVARGFLEVRGFEVETADHGQEAIERLAATSYDAVLMDVQMPLLDGYETTRVLRRDDARARDGRRLPIIAVTATAVTGEREKCLEAGMDDFLTKPLSALALADVLARWTETGTDAVAPDVPGADGVDHAGAPTSPHLDLDRLAELLDLAPDDTRYLDRAIGRFLDNGTEFRDLVAAAVDSADAAALTAAAHAIKGSTSNIGLRVVSRIAGDLEDLGRTGTTVGAEPLQERLGDAVVEAGTAITAYRDWYQSRSVGPVGLEPTT